MPGLSMRRWGKVSALGLALAGFLGWYDAVREQGSLFVCDLARIAGQGEALEICRGNPPPPDEAALLVQIDYLEAQEEAGELTAEQSDRLQRLKALLTERAFRNLMRATGFEDVPVDAQARAATEEAVNETIEEGNPDERRALAMIAEGDVEGGLELLSGLAEAATAENAEQWRRIGRLAYAVDTARALEAYEKVVALDRSDPWDAIYLGRLYERAGATSKALRTYRDALARLPEGEQRQRAVLSSEIGDVLLRHGNLDGALKRYRAAMDIRERLAETDPGNTEWQRDLSVSHNRIGDVLERQGDIAGAIAAYERSLPIARSLADRFPGHAGFQSDIGITERRLEELRAQLE